MFGHTLVVYFNYSSVSIKKCYTSPRILLKDELFPGTVHGLSFLGAARVPQTKARKWPNGKLVSHLYVERVLQSHKKAKRRCVSSFVFNQSKPESIKQQIKQILKLCESEVWRTEIPFMQPDFASNMEIDRDLGPRHYSHRPVPTLTSPHSVLEYLFLPVCTKTGS